MNPVIIDNELNTAVVSTASCKKSGTVRAIASKSVAHRLLIAAALSKENTEIVCPDTSKDIEATANCLINMGADIVKENGVFQIKPISNFEAPAEIDCGESGSTLRFLLPILGIMGKSTIINEHGRLPERPLSPLYEEMVFHGAALSPQGSNPFTVDGKMDGGRFTIKGNISSQYITGLLFALPLSEIDSEIVITGPLESRPYVNITLDVIRSFGIEVTECTVETVMSKAFYPEDTSVIFKIPGNQSYKSSGRYTVEGDWSNAAFFLSAGAISESGVTTTGLNLNSLQGDKKVVDILKEYGAEMEFISNENGLTDILVKKGDLKGIEIDAKDIPDLVPILAAVASVAKGKTVIRNIERLRIKESDRVKTVIDTLSLLGATIYEENNCIVIEGKEALSGGTVDSANDHRIAMMSGIISLCCDGSVTITGKGAVTKSYPLFYEDLLSILV